MIRNENNFVGKVRQTDSTKIEEQKLKVAVATEQRNKQSEQMERLAKERAEADKVEKVKERYEALAEQAQKKTGEERSKLQEAALKAKIQGQRKALAKKKAYHASKKEHLLRMKYADDYCLNLRHGRRVPGTPVNLWKCNPKSHAQRWKLYGDGTVRLGLDHRWCVSLKSDTAGKGDRLRLERCVLNRTQLWKRITDGSIRFLARPDYAITVHKGVVANGQHLEMGKRVHASPDQEWVIAPVSSRPRYAPARYLALRDRFLRDNCMNLRRTSMTDGATVNVMRCRKGHGQLWRYDTRDKTVRLARRPGYCLELKGNVRSAGQPVQLAMCGGRPRARQRWKMDARGYLRLMFHPKWVVDIKGGRGRGHPASSTPLVLSTVQRSRQKWQTWQVRDPDGM